MSRMTVKSLPKMIIALSLLLLGSTGRCYSQSIQEKRDSIRASMITADKSHARDAGLRIVPSSNLSSIVSSTGEADVIKYIQTLPGVSTGSEGSSAVFVRGGNLGGNLQTLDGVPLYGNSHILGMSTVYSQDIISSAQFQIGGFSSEEGNLTSSHIKLNTADGDFTSVKGNVSVSNFMFGAMLSAPVIKGRMSIIASARVSPLGLELSAVKGLSSALDSISNIRSAIYDAFIKVSYRTGPRNILRLSWFNSLDSYGYSNGRASDDQMRWSNSIVNMTDNLELGKEWSLESQISYNRFTNYQGMRKILSGNDNNLAIQSFLGETIGQTTLKGKLFNMFDYQGGLKVRYALFSPAAAGHYSESIIGPLEQPKDKDIVNSLLSTLHSQIEWRHNEKYSFRLSGRLNNYYSHRINGNERISRPVDGELGMMGMVRITPWMGVEATADWTKQYYHTLEGLPLGWNLDMIVPADMKCPPEKAKQLYLGWFGSFAEHSLSLGVYTKQMSNLVYLPDAAQVFSSASAGWRSDVKIGDGSSKGMEFLYEKDGDKLDWKLSYTLSKTDRLFEQVNRGLPFPAKYDRRHIFNLNVNYTFVSSDNKRIGATAFFTYQSGHWETVPSGHMTGFVPPYGNAVDISYYSGQNNWRLPAYIRSDVGVYLGYGLSNKHPGQLNIGIYNLMNRHNPYSLTYDANERKWKQISLFPIMPCINWRMSF